MHGGDKVAYALPSGDDAAIAQYLLLYEMSNGRELDKLVSFDSASPGPAPSAPGRYHLSDGVFAVFRGHGQGAHGGEPRLRSMNDLLADGQRQSFLAAYGRERDHVLRAPGSFQLGLLSMLPNIFPVFVTLGLMGVSGICMDIPLAGFSAIIIGVVVDDTIHFLFHYRESFARTSS